MRVDFKDVVGGALIAFVGAYAVIMAPKYEIGTPTHMGSGFVPLALGIILIVMGACITVPALFTGATVMERVEWRPILAILGAIAAFGIITDWFGYLPGTGAAAALSSFADTDTRPLDAVLLAAGVTVGVWLIFTVGLQIPPVALKSI